MKRGSQSGSGKLAQPRRRGRRAADDEDGARPRRQTRLKRRKIDNYWQQGKDAKRWQKTKGERDHSPARPLLKVASRPTAAGPVVRAVLAERRPRWRLLAGGESVGVADESMLEELFGGRAVGMLDFEGLLEEVVGFG